MTVTRTDFIGVPATDVDRARAFYQETLGLKRDPHAEYECWAGGTCFAVWDPTQFGMEFVAQKGNPWALGVEDVPAERERLEAEGVQFYGDTFDTGVCHMAMFSDTEGNDLMLHNRYAPYED
ncbi:glyoxalase/bleomycin resistance/dioxygenase family protein [Thermoleophilia bacterium SCSIO 60948]|nr:glyoxalase/bleomycin resistance/dioxygenase family protein [Thermoleophilia bacterium SCSIO 60948]